MDEGALVARPRVFVSSTYYDLKYIRASLELFIETLGFDAILSEKGDIAYAPDRPLDESCYREVDNADIFVLIVGGRYGSEATSEKRTSKEFFDRYESITKHEYNSATDKDIPVYILIEKSVYSEYHTFIRNKDNAVIKYAHVDSVNVFLLVDEILSKPRNNPIQTFEKFEEIEDWLREQWAGLFRELLRRQTQQQQLSSLSQQVVQLKEINETLKKYLEAVLRGMGTKENSALIASEEKRLSEVEQIERIRSNPFIRYLARRGPDLSSEAIIESVRDARNLTDLTKKILSNAAPPEAAYKIWQVLCATPRAGRDLNEARAALGVPQFDIRDELPDLEQFARGELRPSMNAHERQSSKGVQAKNSNPVKLAATTSATRKATTRSQRTAAKTPDAK